MKGHTTIELKDVNTGCVEVYEDDNMMTNALNVYLASGGMGSSDNGLGKDAVRNYPLWQSLIGGLLLFDSQLNEDVSNVVPSAGVTMTGNGAYGISNSSDVTELGSYNVSESGEQEDGSIKMVWDFSTAQANGTIACACLTSRYAGYCGYGNMSGNRRTDGAVNGAGFSDFFGQPFSSVNSEYTEDKNGWSINVLYADYAENSLYVLDSESMYYQNESAEKHWHSTGKIRINKYRYGISAVHIKETSGITMNNMIESYDITVPDAIVSYFTNYTSNRYRIHTNGNDVYIVFCNNDTVAPGENCFILHINAAMQATSYKIINTGSKTFYAINACFFVTSDKYAVFKMAQSPHNLYKIKMNDNTDITEIEMMNSNWNDYCYMINDIIYSRTNSTVHLTDTKKNRDLILNGNSGFEQWMTPVYGNPLMMLVKVQRNTSVILYIKRNCGYLATINNLEEPVVKTASKTMKVTYTITVD